MARPTEIPLARAASLYAAQRYAEAAGCYRAVLSIDPTDRRAFLGLADCSVGRGRTEDAIDELVGAAADFRDREDYDGAFALLARALSIDPERLELHIDVAELEAASGRIEMAIGRLENLARAYDQSSQYEDAAAIHEVIEVWLSGGNDDEVQPEQIQAQPTEPQPERIEPMDLRTLVAEAVPVHVLSGNTQKAYVAPLMAEPPPLPETRPPHELLVRPEIPGSPKPTPTAVTESVLLRKAPPPPPPPRAIRAATAVPTQAPPQQTQPNELDAPAKDAAASRRRGPRRESVAPRWQPSTVQGMPEMPSKKLRAKRPTAPTNKERKSIVEPAPSPKRGAVKLDKLPALSGPAPARKRAAAIPRRTPTKHTALLHPHLPSAAKEAPQAAVVAKVQFNKKTVAAAPRPSATRPPSAARPSARPESPRPQPQPRRKTPTLADRLRQTSAGPQVPVAIEIDDEPTRLWAPDHLLL